MKNLPVLLYHSIDDDPPTWIAPFTVGPRAFARQLDRVVDSGRVPVSASAVADALTGGPALPDNAVVITFDDGFHDFTCAALPALHRRGLPAALFVTTGSLQPGSRSLLPPARMMTKAEVIEAADAGVEIGAHTHTHPQLDAVPRRKAQAELTISKHVLEETLRRHVDLLAYPHGYSDAAVRHLARRSGYRSAFAVRNALSPAADDPFRIARLTVRADTPPERFDGWLRGEGAPIAAPREAAATKIWRLYRRTRAASSCLRDRRRGTAPTP